MRFIRTDPVFAHPRFLITVALALLPLSACTTTKNAAAPFPPPAQTQPQSGDVLATERAREKLNQAQVELQVTEQPLSKVISYLRDQSDLRFNIDWKTLEQATVPIDPSTPVTVYLSKVTYAAALRALLNTLDGPHCTYAYAIDAGVIIISTRAKLLNEKLSIEDWVSNSATDTTATQRAHDRLDQTFPDFVLQAQPFAKVLGFIDDSIGGNLVIKWNVIQGLPSHSNKNTPVTLTMHDVTFATALRATLDSAATPGVPLAYTIDSGVITISTKDDLAGR